MDDFGYLSTDRNASFQLDHSQELINTRLDETLDQVTGHFIPDIATLGRPVRARDDRSDGPRPFPDIHHYPYETTAGARARLYQRPYIPRHPRATLHPQHVTTGRSNEQIQLIADIHNNETPVITADGSQTPHTLTVAQPTGVPTPAPASQSPTLDPTLNQTRPVVGNGLDPTEAVISAPPAADENSQAADMTPQPAAEATLDNSSSSASANSTNISTDSTASLGSGVSRKKIMTPPNEPPLADSVAGAILFQAAPDHQEESQAGNSQENTRVLRSEMTAPAQPPEFWTFVHALTEHYNEDTTKFSGLESSLTPLLTQDHVTSKFKLREDLLTNRNLTAIELLMKDMDKKKTSLFTRKNPILKTILQKFVKIT